MDEGIYANFDCSVIRECPKEFRFVVEPPVELLCALCCQLLRDPFQTQCCGRYCCQVCLRARVSKGKPCDLCHSQVKAFRDVNVARRVNELAVNCSNEASGCKWSGELGELGRHLLVCSKRPVTCNVCGDSMLRKDLDTHKSTLCAKRTFRCPHCDSFESTYETVRDDHWPTCSFYPIPCPNECGERSIPRGKVWIHLQGKCNVKQRVKEMGDKLSELEEQLQQRDLRIEQLENETKHENGVTGKCNLSSVSCVEQLQLNLEKIKFDNIQLVERMTEVQKERAELKHKNTCLIKKMEAQESRIHELEIQNKNFRENLDRMSHELSSQLEVMKVMNYKLRDEKEMLETRLSESQECKSSKVV